jgi:2'-5' RNA ligase
VHEKKADRQRFWVTYLLKDLEEGSTFKPQEMHLTIIPWFVTEKGTSEVVLSFRQLLSGSRSFMANIGEIYEFKSRRKIPVNMIEPSKDLLNLHMKILKWFSLLEARWAVKNPYVGNEYIPHIRRRPGHNLMPGQNLKIDSLSLIGAYRRGDDVRTVLAKVNFDE